MSQECKAEAQYLLLAIHQLLLNGLSSLVREQGEYEDISELDTNKAPVGPTSITWFWRPAAAFQLLLDFFSQNIRCVCLSPSLCSAEPSRPTERKSPELS